MGRVLVGPWRTVRDEGRDASAGAVRSPRRRSRVRPEPTWDDNGMVIPVMLATLTDRRDFGDDWLLERKFDGERCVARKEGMVVRLESRTGTDLTGTYPEVHAAVAAQLSRDLLLDGEVVAYDGDQTSFTRLQQRLGATAPSPGWWTGTRSSIAPSTSWRSTGRISPSNRSSSVAPG